jgi:hypothetical protein
LLLCELSSLRAKLRRFARNEDAVVALFKRPPGPPIPHTAIIQSTTEFLLRLL